MPKTKTPPSTPGQRLREIRTGAGLSQAKLATRADVHTMTVRKIELGTLELSTDVALKLASALEVSPGRLLPVLATGPKRCPHCGGAIE